MFITSMQNQDPPLFFKYIPQPNAICIVPNTYIDYGCILKVYNYALSSSTYTFIYKKKHNCEMFIAPISKIDESSTHLVFYDDYCKNIHNQWNRENTEVVSKSPTYTELQIHQPNTIENTSVHGNVQMHFIEVEKNSEKVNKLMEIFHMEQPSGHTR